MQVDSAGQVHACALRAARLDDNGAPVAGANNGFLTTSFARLRRSPQVEAGTEVNPRDACGGIAFSYRGRDITVRWNLELDLIKPDPEFEELLVSAPLITRSMGGRTIAADTTSGSPIITSANASFTAADIGRGITGTGIAGGTTILSVQSATQATLSANATANGTAVALTIANSATTIGAEAPELNVVPDDGGLSLEVWARAVVGSAQASLLPWWRFAFPRTYWRPNEQEFGNAESRPTFVGYAVENPMWGNGPWNDWRQLAADTPPSPHTLSRAFGRHRTDVIPTAAQAGYITVPTQ